MARQHARADRCGSAGPTEHTEAGGAPRRVRIASRPPERIQGGSTRTGRHPDIRRGPLGVSVRGALSCSQVFRHRRAGDRRRADGAATSRHPVRRRCGHPGGLRHRRPATGGTTASYLPVLDVPASSSAVRRVATAVWSSVLRSARHPQPVPTGATSPKGVLRRLLEPPKGLVRRGSGPVRVVLDPVHAISEEAT